jgi:hypothetical protein
MLEGTETVQKHVVGDINVVKQVSVFVLSELVRQKCECYMVHAAYIYSVA